MTSVLLINKQHKKQLLLDMRDRSVLAVFKDIRRNCKGRCVLFPLNICYTKAQVIIINLIIGFIQMHVETDW